MPQQSVKNRLECENTEGRESPSPTWLKTMSGRVVSEYKDTKIKTQKTLKKKKKKLFHKINATVNIKDRVLLVLDNLNSTHPNFFTYSKYPIRISW